MTYRKHILVLACLTLVCLVPATAPALTVYDNFGPDHDGFDYNWGLGWTVAGENVAAQFGVEQAMLFTPQTGGMLTDIWVAMWYVPIDAGVDAVTLYLATGAYDTPPQPEDVLAEWTLTEFGSWSQWNPPHHLTSDATIMLEAGQPYWLWAVAATETTWCGWCMNPEPGFTCPHAMRREGEDWLSISDETASAFRVDVEEGVSVQNTTWSEVKRLFD